MTEEHMPGCAALKCRHIYGSVTRYYCQEGPPLKQENGRIYPGDHAGGHHEFEPEGPCNCELGRLRAEVKRLVGRQKEIEIEKRGMAYDIHKLHEALKNCAETAYKEAVEAGCGHGAAQMIYHAVKTEMRKALEEQARMTYKGFSEMLSDAKERVIFWKEKCALIEAENKVLEAKNEKLRADLNAAMKLPAARTIFELLGWQRRALPYIEDIAGYPWCKEVAPHHLEKVKKLIAEAEEQPE